MSAFLLFIIGIIQFVICFIKLGEWIGAPGFLGTLLFFIVIAAFAGGKGLVLIQCLFPFIAWIVEGVFPTFIFVVWGIGWLILFIVVFIEKDYYQY